MIKHYLCLFLFLELLIIVLLFLPIFPLILLTFLLLIVFSLLFLLQFFFIFLLDDLDLLLDLLVLSLGSSFCFVNYWRAKSFVFQMAWTDVEVVLLVF